MSLQHQLILEKATQRGIEIQDVSDEFQTIASILTKGKKSELLVEGTPTSLLNVRSQFYCDNKQLTKKALEAANVPHPKSIIFRNIATSSISTFLQKGKTYVCKPLDMTNGVGVRLNIKHLEDVHNYWEAYKHLNTSFMLEEQIEGKDLRVQVLAGKIIAACTRKPAFVVGDGQSNIEKLIIERRAFIKSKNPDNKLDIDAVTLDLLQLQEVNLQSIIPSGKEIQLKRVANMGQGALAIDLTDELHPNFQDWITRIANYLQTDYFGIDLIASDHQHPDFSKAWVLEINARPEWIHHTFSEVRQHDIPNLLLDHLFG